MKNVQKQEQCCYSLQSDYKGRKGHCVEMTGNCCECCHVGQAQSSPPCVWSALLHIMCVWHSNINTSGERTPWFSNLHSSLPSSSMKERRDLWRRLKRVTVILLWQVMLDSVSGRAEWEAPCTHCLFPWQIDFPDISSCSHIDWKHIIKMPLEHHSWASNHKVLSAFRVV